MTRVPTPTSWVSLHRHSVSHALFVAACLTSVASAQSSDRRLTIGILPFADATGGGTLDAGVSVGRLVQAEMMRATKVQSRFVTAENIDPANIGPDQAAALGRAQNAPVVLIGTVIEGKNEESRKGGWLPSIRGQSVRVDVRAVKGKVVLQGDLISSATGDLLATVRATGEVTDKQFSGTLYSTFGSWDSWDNFLASPMGKALRKAVEELVKRIDARAATFGKTESNDAPATTHVTQATQATPSTSPSRAPAVQSVVPLRTGLTIVTAVFREDLGDYESTKIVTVANEKEIQVAFAGQEVRVTRTVQRSDLDTARLLRAGFNNDDDAKYPGSTALGTSTRVLRELLAKGQATVGLQVGDGGSHFGTLKRLDGPGNYSAILNDERVDLPAIRTRGKLDGSDAQVVFLNDPTNPLVLQFRFDDRTLDVIRILYPSDATGGSRIERELANRKRVDVYGIYFDFGSDRIRPESEAVLKEIADVLKKNPDWTLNVAGHTDNIGSDSDNQDLSERRAAAVKKALVDRHRVRANRLETAGFGESQPKESNTTLQGRARNRRVELSRR